MYGYTFMLPSKSGRNRLERQECGERYIDQFFAGLTRLSLLYWLDRGWKDLDLLLGDHAQAATWCFCGADLVHSDTLLLGPRCEI